ncbi:MAG: thioredoxin domain-containing protein [Nautiliaceae bacterium]
MNRLKNSDSPYLLANATNPVAWYPWCEEAFEKAKKENKLIFLSIGYSTCHWCHVMEKESFKNKEIAEILNRYFVSIKVDKEEYPDIDKKYQKIYHIMHNRPGGWPLTVIMTPQGDVFYSAIYIPPHFSQFGSGLKEILLDIVNDWQIEPSKILKIAQNLKRYLVSKPSKKVEISKDVENDIKSFVKNLDFKYGGIKGTPKFPMESMLNLLIDVYQLSEDEEILEFLNVTFLNMAKGGIFDQVEGGFFRYSTDSKWEIPHFEKMLYNNANLPFEFLRMYEVTQNLFYKDVAFRSLDEMLKKYRDNNFLFFSASDADIDSKEGAYFVYDYEEAIEAFEEFDNKDELLEFFGVKKYGNFNGKNHLTIKSDKFPKNYKKALEKLQEIREKRNFPFIDTKKIVSWNSMIISTLFKAGCFKKEYKQEALKSLNTLLEIMYDDTLYHSYNKDLSKKTPSLLEDYAYLIRALIDAYETTFEKDYLQKAKLFLKEVEKFYKKKWYMNKTFTVEADFSDSAYASSLSVLAADYLRIGTILYDLDLYSKGEEIVKEGSFYIQNYAPYYPSLTKAYLMQKYGVFVVNMPKIECLGFYPYLERKESDEYELCSVRGCFCRGSLKDVKKTIKTIKELNL